MRLQDKVAIITGAGRGIGQATAIKFTQEGEVSIRLKVDSQTDEDTVIRFLISDTGIGIAAENHDRLFKAFSQTDGTMNRKACVPPSG